MKFTEWFLLMNAFVKLGCPLMNNLQTEKKTCFVKQTATNSSSNFMQTCIFGYSLGEKKIYCSQICITCKKKKSETKDKCRLWKVENQVEFWCKCMSLSVEIVCITILTWRAEKWNIKVEVFLHVRFRTKATLSLKIMYNSWMRVVVFSVWFEHSKDEQN